MNPRNNFIFEAEEAQGELFIIGGEAVQYVRIKMPLIIGSRKELRKLMNEELDHWFDMMDSEKAEQEIIENSGEQNE